jgi:hypothetical protein
MKDGKILGKTEKNGCFEKIVLIFSIVLLHIKIEKYYI